MSSKVWFKPGGVNAIYVSSGGHHKLLLEDLLICLDYINLGIDIWQSGDETDGPVRRRESEIWAA